MQKRRAGWLIYLFAGFVPAYLLVETPPPISFPVSNEKLQASIQAPVIREELVSGDLTKEVHSATATELANGDIALFWYAGSREGSADVAIHGRFLRTADDTGTPAWSEIREVIGRSRSIDGLQRYIRKIGNPLGLYHRDTLWLFYVTVSVGGWGGSSINLIQSKDNGKSWSSPKRLVTSPLINISTLVKEKAVIAKDGSVLLPVYHEFIGKFSELLHLDPQGEVINKYRITNGRKALQPVMLPLSKKKAVVFMRNVTDSQHPTIRSSLTRDGGASWQPLPAMELPNPNSAVSSVCVDRPEELLLVFNNDGEERSDITLAYAENYRAGESGQWRIIYQFENETGQKTHGEDLHNPYSYPFLIKTMTGDFHLFYTWKKQFIKHVFFNRESLNQMLTRYTQTQLSQVPNLR